jgi:hypothetical protein
VALGEGHAYCLGVGDARYDVTVPERAVSLRVLPADLSTATVIATLDDGTELPIAASVDPDVGF